MGLGVVIWPVIVDRGDEQLSSEPLLRYLSPVPCPDSYLLRRPVLSIVLGRRGRLRGSRPRFMLEFE